LISQEIGRVLGEDELAPFARLLLDAIKWLPPASKEMLTLTRGSKLPIAQYRIFMGAVGRVL
jgi:hypothetical protein